MGQSCCINVQNPRLGIMNITILVLLVEYPLAVVLGAKLYMDGAAMAPLS